MLGICIWNSNPNGQNKASNTGTGTNIEVLLFRFTVGSIRIAVSWNGFHRRKAPLEVDAKLLWFWVGRALSKKAAGVSFRYGQKPIFVPGHVLVVNWYVQSSGGRNVHVRADLIGRFRTFPNATFLKISVQNYHPKLSLNNDNMRIESDFSSFSSGLARFIIISNANLGNIGKILVFLGNQLSIIYSYIKVKLGLNILSIFSRFRV